MDSQEDFGNSLDYMAKEGSSIILRFLAWDAKH